MRKLICYCFNYSAEDIKQDYLKNGHSTIMGKIQLEKKSGDCQCAKKTS
ncbi:MAG: BFD-like (2Fe-2S) protein [Desulfobacteraceae bacterium]|nr:MAG: BFD-like (2Fe-2S) protein [Desulfobacteraceae bacterium]